MWQIHFWDVENVARSAPTVWLFQGIKASVLENAYKDDWHCQCYSGRAESIEKKEGFNGCSRKWMCPFKKCIKFHGCYVEKVWINVLLGKLGVNLVSKCFGEVLHTKAETRKKMCANCSLVLSEKESQTWNVGTRTYLLILTLFCPVPSIFRGAMFSVPWLNGRK